MNTNMTGFRRFFKILCILVLGLNVASALKGLTVNNVTLLLFTLVTLAWSLSLRGKEGFLFLKGTCKLTFNQYFSPRLMTRYLY